MDSDFRKRKLLKVLHTKQAETHVIYFCTVTCYNWLPLIEEAGAYRSVYRWFGFLKHDGCKLIGYVIMPNHFHVMLFPTHTGTSINQMIGECKRFMAYDIVASIKKQGKLELLGKLAKGVTKSEKRINKKHQVFKTSFDYRLCDGERSVEQRLEYMHHNPVSGKWHLVEDFVNYKHSSARFYELNREIAGVEICHYQDL
jgi:REP element-mobilizing transposase RayT